MTFFSSNVLQNLIMSNKLFITDFKKLLMLSETLLYTTREKVEK